MTDQSPGACAVVAEGTEVSLAYNTPYPASPGADETAGDNVTGGDLPGFGPGPNEVAGADEMSEGDLPGFGPDPNEGTGGANIADGDLPGFGPPVDDGNATTVADGELPGFGDSETDAGSGPGLGNLGQGDTEYLPDDEQAQVAPVQGSVGLVPDLSGILPSSVWDDAFDAGTLETSSDAAPGVAQPLPQAPRPAAPRSGVDVMDQARQDQARQIAAEAAADRQKNPPAPNWAESALGPLLDLNRAVTGGGTPTPPQRPSSRGSSGGRPVGDDSIGCRCPMGYSPAWDGNGCLINVDNPKYDSESGRNARIPCNGSGGGAPSATSGPCRFQTLAVGSAAHFVVVQRASRGTNYVVWSIPPPDVKVCRTPTDCMQQIVASRMPGSRIHGPYNSASAAEQAAGSLCAQQSRGR